MLPHRWLSHLWMHFLPCGPAFPHAVPPALKPFPRDRHGVYLLPAHGIFRRPQVVVGQVGGGFGELEQGGAIGSHKPCPPIGWLLPWTRFRVIIGIRLGL